MTEKNPKKMEIMAKRVKKALSVIMALGVFLSSFPSGAHADIWPFGNAVYGTPQDEEIAKRVLKVDQILDKAREKRFQGRFKEAKALAESAIRVDKDSKLAQSFLEYLPIEEARWNNETDRLKRVKQEERQRKIDEKKRARDAKQAERMAAQSAKKEAEKISAAAAPGMKPMPSAGVATAPEAALGEPGMAPQEEAALPEEVPPEPAWRAEEIEKEAKEAAAGMPAGETSEVDLPVAGGEGFKVTKGQPIIVNGDKVEYYEEGKILAEGHVTITYGDVKLSCDKIEVDTKSRTALCEGKVWIESPDGVVTGDRVVYDFENMKGLAEGIDLKAYPWFAQAKETERVSENHYRLREGCISTCDHDSPHYRLTAKEIEVYPGDKLIARNVTMYIGKIPVMFIPYYYQPSIETKAKAQFIPGMSKDWGYFLLSAWRVHLKGNTKADLLLDYRTRKGFAEGANLYYHMEDFGLNGLGEGTLRAYFVEENDWGTLQKKAYRDDDTKPKLRKRIQWRHRIDFDPGTVGLLEFNKQSDKYFIEDYFYNEYEEQNNTLPSYLSLISAKENYIFSFETSKRFNSFDDMVQ
ncbi:MAG: hypothetical protein PHW14_03700, partial [Candidatus Omnitrophica bacterium]|nr:hypothetical protein [Candidatus Omnitrophota bacterium]